MKREYIVLVGVPEVTRGNVEDRRATDAEVIQEIGQAVGCVALVPEDVKRIGKMDSTKPRLLRFKCRSHKMRDILLKKARDLRHSTKFRHVYISPDLTHSQREKNRFLRQELKTRLDNGERVKILHNRVVPVEENESPPIFQ